MRYPVINGILPPLEPIKEYHIVTPRGVLASVYEDKNLAVQRLTPGFKLLEVVRRVREITPTQQAA